MPDFAEALSRFSSNPTVSGEPAPEPEAQVTGPLASVFARLESNVTLARPENVIPAFLKGKLRDETTWEQVAPQLQSNFGVDPEQYRQHYQLDEARAVQKGEGIGTVERWLGSSIPFGSAIRNWRDERKLGDAVKRFQEVKATGEDAARIARHERMAEVEKGMGTGASALAEVTKIPAILGEFAAGGSAVRGLGLAKGGGIGSKALAGSLATPAVPSTYLAAGARNQAANPDESLFQSYAPPVAMAMAQNAVLGQLQTMFSGANITRAGRIGAKTVVGMAEAQAADTALTGLDRVTKEVTDKSLGLDTKWGTLGSVLRGDEGAGKQAAVQFLTFSVFSAMHSGREIPHEVFKKATEAAKPEQVAEVGKAVQDGTFDPKTPGSVGDLGRAYTEAVKKAEPASVWDKLSKEEQKQLKGEYGITKEMIEKNPYLLEHLGFKDAPDSVPAVPEARKGYLDVEPPQKPAEAAPEPPVQVPAAGEIARPDASGEVSGPGMPPPTASGVVRQTRTRRLASFGKTVEELAGEQAAPNHLAEAVRGAGLEGKSNVMADTEATVGNISLRYRPEKHQVQIDFGNTREAGEPIHKRPIGAADMGTARDLVKLVAEFKKKGMAIDYKLADGEAGEKRQATNVRILTKAGYAEVARGPDGEHVWKPKEMLTKLERMRAGSKPVRASSASATVTKTEGRKNVIPEPKGEEAPKSLEADLRERIERSKSLNAEERTSLDHVLFGESIAEIKKAGVKSPAWRAQKAFEKMQKENPADWSHYADYQDLVDKVGQDRARQLNERQNPEMTNAEGGRIGSRPAPSARKAARTKGDSGVELTPKEAKRIAKLQKELKKELKAAKAEKRSPDAEKVADIRKQSQRIYDRAHKRNEPAPEPKQSRRESVQAIVTRLGGIDPKSHAFLTHFSSVKEAKENGINLKVFRKGGRGLDQLAQEMHARGELPDASTQTLIDALQRGELARTADRSITDEQRLEDDARKQQEQHDAGREQAIADFFEPSNETEAYLTDDMADAPNPARTMPPSNRGGGTTGGGSGLGESAPSPRDHTSALMNAKRDADRALRGKDPIMSEARAADPEVWDAAMKAIDADPKLPDRLVARLAVDPDAATTLMEDAILLHEIVNQKNVNDTLVIEANMLYMEARKLWQNPEEQKLKYAEADLAAAAELNSQNRLEVLDRVARDTGTVWSRKGRFRQQLAREDYSLTPMLMRAERKKGAPLNENEKAKIIELQAELETIQKKLAAAEERDAKAEAGKAEQPAKEAAPEPGLVEKAVKWLKDLFRPKIGARSKTWEYADQLEQSATAELSKKMKGDISFSNFDPTLIVPLAKYAAAKIIKTGLTFADFTKGLVNKFGEDVKPHLDAIWKQAQEHAAPDTTADLRIKVKQTKAKFEEMTDKMQRENQSAGRRVLGAVGESINVSRAIKTSIDLSMILRQGAFGAFGHPLRTAKSIGETLKAFVSEHAGEKARDDIEQRENRHLYEKAGLDITDTGVASKQEEGFMGRLLKHNPTLAEWKTPWKLPLNLLKFGVSGSGRAYTTFLNRMRADMFDAAAATMPIKGKPTLNQAKDIADMTNVATGRGDLGAAERIATKLSQLLFSPRFMMSRFQLLLATPLWRAKTPEVRKWIVKEYARAAAGVGVFYTLASLLNDDESITFDPRSTDFGKVKINNTRIDPLAGLSQATVFLTKLFGGEEVKDGKVGSLRDNFIPRKWITGDKETKVPFDGRNTKDVVFDFGRNKLAPVPGLASDLAFDRRDYDPKTHKHMKVTPGYAANQLLAPMGVEDVIKAMMDLGVPRGAAASILAILGMGSRTYESKPLKK